MWICSKIARTLYGIADVTDDWFESKFWFELQTVYGIGNRGCYYQDIELSIWKYKY